MRMLCNGSRINVDFYSLPERSLFLSQIILFIVHYYVFFSVIIFVFYLIVFIPLRCFSYARDLYILCNFFF